MYIDNLILITAVDYLKIISQSNTYPTVKLIYHLIVIFYIIDGVTHFLLIENYVFPILHSAFKLVNMLKKSQFFLVNEN